jgi:putrescine aminotransferase
LAYEKVSKELARIIGYIKSDDYSEAVKKTIVSETLRNFETYVNPGRLKYRKAISTDCAVIEHKDYGNYIEGLNGEKFIDCFGGFGIYTIGHRNPEVVDVVRSQLNHQALHSQELLDPLRGYLAKTMSEITPGNLQKCFFTNGGAEAVEMALKLARIATGGSYFISMVNGFHGKSMGALSVTGKANYRTPYRSMVQQVEHVTFGDAEGIDKAIREQHAVDGKVAAVILEPIQGEAGVIVPPEGYLREVRKICTKRKVALIFDEIQTGMGRTGHFWRCQAEDVTPDIMTFGKAFGGGIVPITGIICRPSMWVNELVENPLLLGSPTFGGNPLCCSAALATIKYMIDNDIPGQCREKGEKLKAGLQSLKERFPALIKDVRGVGLMLAMEFISDEVGYDVSKGMFSRRVITAGTLLNAKTVRFEPAALITDEIITAIINVMAEALTETQRRFLPEQSAEGESDSEQGASVK